MTTIGLVLLWTLLAGSVVLAFHELRHRDPPNLLPPPEQPIDFTNHRRT
jgi:hypothetical protein